MVDRNPARCVCAAAFLLLVSTASHAVPVHVVNMDLKPLIRAGAQSQVQFAALVPHAASTKNTGTYSVGHGRTTWSYVAEVPTAVSLSFHAAQSSLPESAWMRCN